MHLPRFAYMRASSIEEAARILQEEGPEARLVAGGTDLYPRMKYGLVSPRLVVSLKGRTPVAPFLDGEGGLHLDAFMTLAAAAGSPLVKEKQPLYAEAALKVASGQIRNMAAVGGNICLESRCLYFNQSHTFQFVAPCFKRGGDLCYFIPQGKKCLAVFAADTSPALISLRAKVVVVSCGVVHSLPIEELYSGDAAAPLTLKQGEIVTEVVIPDQGRLCGYSFLKFSLRGAVDFAALNVAAVLWAEEDGRTCRDARLAAGAAAPSPVRLCRVEETLKGETLSAELFAAAAQAAAAEARPLPHHGYSAPYLRHCLEVHVRRALEASWEMIRRTRESQ